MIYIGLISKNKNIDFIKEVNTIENVQAINIKKEEDLKNKKIDILVLEDLIIEEKLLKKVMCGTKYLILQDNISNIEINLDNEINIITFGFNHKSTVTISSITDENIVICIQRTIKNINNKNIIPQEKNIKNDKKNNINKHIIKKIIEELVAI